jgi:hypothetical protein
MSVYDILEPNLWVQIFYSNQLLVGWLVGWLVGCWGLMIFLHQFAVEKKTKMAKNAHLLN